jgi:DNA-binding transcriptional MerR regulator
MLTIGRLARTAGLSRSTLLYYDRIGLLRPSRRTAAGYRAYDQGDAARLERIRVLRETGLPLAQIKRLLSAPPGSETARVLESQLGRLAAQIAALRGRQRLVVKLLGKPRLLEDASPMNRARWTTLLRAAGFDDAAMRRWHEDFERTAPREHQEFLEFLGIPDDEVARIRRWSRR